MASKLVELAPDLDAWLMKAEAQTRVNPQERFVVFSRFCATWRMRAWDVWDFQTFLEGRVGSRVILLARESLRNITGTPWPWVVGCHYSQFGPGKMTIPLNDLASASEPFGEADTLLASGTFSALVHVVAGSSHDPLVCLSVSFRKTSS